MHIIKNLVCIGGGPAGLYSALLLKTNNPEMSVTVIERNKPHETFGWGVVFSESTLDNLRLAHAESAENIFQNFNYWDEIDVIYNAETITSGGHGFIGIGRKKLLNILQDACSDCGVNLVYEEDVTDEQAVLEKYEPDIVIASDGAFSKIRSKYEAEFEPDIQNRFAKFVWLGTERKFDAFTFAFEKTEHGWFAAHAYKFNEDMSTFIVETSNDTWHKAGIEHMSKQEGIDYCEKIFANHLQGHRLISNSDHLRGSAAWINFPRIIVKHWVHNLTNKNGRKVPLVLMGDAAHTAHFSIGSGTKLALEDAIDFANVIQGEEKSLDAALKKYESVRRIEVLKIQNAARNSMEWFEEVHLREKLSPIQFSYSLMTRSQRLSHENLRVRDPAYIEMVEKSLAEDGQARMPMHNPFSLRGTRLHNRVVFAPMALSQAKDGVVGDYHLMMLGARAVGGAGLVMTETVAVNAAGRLSLTSPGLWNDEQQHAWKRVTNFVHQHSAALVGIQLGHAGGKAGVKDARVYPYEPLDEADRWATVSASELVLYPGYAKPSEISVQGIHEVTAAFVQSAKNAVQAGFDWIELNFSEGFLLSSFISPLTNIRKDKYGGSFENRLRFPRELVAAVREVIAEIPLAVKISTTDWHPEGHDIHAGVNVAAALYAAGADIMVCSSGGLSSEEKPIYGRMFQVPHADRIRNTLNKPVIAVGAITQADEVNTIVASGRADLCAIGRGFLTDSNWALNQAEKLRAVVTPGSEAKR